MITKIEGHNNTFSIHLPKKLTDRMGWKFGDILLIEIKNKSLWISKEIKQGAEKHDK